MNMLCRARIFGAIFHGGILFTGLVLALAEEPPATNAVPTTVTRSDSNHVVAPLILIGKKSTHPQGIFFEDINEIVKMLDAKVDLQVILAFIQNAGFAYNPTADDLIRLREHGASSEMLMALLRSGDNGRASVPQVHSEVSPPPAAPATSYVRESAYPANPSEYTDAGEVPSPSTEYGYPYGAWPWVYGPSVYVGWYQPYVFVHGRWCIRGDGGHYFGNGGPWHHPTAPGAAPHSVSAPVSGQAGSVAPASGYRVSVRVGGAPAGRAR